MGAEEGQRAVPRRQKGKFRAAENAICPLRRMFLQCSSHAEFQQKQGLRAQNRTASNLRGLLRVPHEALRMSTIQNSTNASYAAQWQYLQALQQQQQSSGTQGSSGASSSQSFDPFAGLGEAMDAGQGGGMPCPPLSTDTISAMIDAQEQSGGAAGLSKYQQQIFGELDADGDGKVTGDEIKGAFGDENADAASYVLSKLDIDGDGSISQSEFGAGTTRGPGHHHHHMHGMGSGQGPQGAQALDPLQQLLEANGASATSNANADGSNTTTITYSDGSKVSMTAEVPASGDTSAGNTALNSMQQNLLEQLIKMQSQLIQSASITASNSLATI